MSGIVKIIGLGAICVVGVGYAMSKSVDSGGLDFNPGLWESTTTVSSNLTGSQSNTQTQCMTSDSFDPEEIAEQMLGNTDHEDCTSDVDINGSSMTFDMQCESAQGSVDVTGYWSFSGDEGSGNMDMELDAQGMSMTMEMEFESQRIGDC